MSWNPVGPPRPRASIRCQLSCHTAGWQGERDQERDHSAQWHHSGSSALTTGSSLRSVTKIGDAPEFEPGMEVLQCSAPAENKGNLACFVEVLAPNLVDVGLVLADNGSGLGTAPACPPLPLCSRDGRRVLLRMHQHSSRHRHEDGGEGDDRSIAHGHGLSSDDHDDAGVDSDLPLAGRGNNGRPRTESASGDPVAGIAPSTSSQSTPNCARLVPEIVVYCQPSGSISR